MEDNEIIDEAFVNNNRIHVIPNNIQLISKGTVKIQINTKIASGFFLKIKRDNKPFHCLITNQHVITKDMVDNKEAITIIYDNENKVLKLRLDIKKRIIVCFKDFYYLDITLVEIIKDDKIKDEFYLLPDVDHNNQFQNFNKKNIEIVQYPEGKVLSFSGGKIEELNKDNANIFYHTASTTVGSSGSPIILKGEDKVLAIHRGALKGQNKNIGIFIKDIIDIMKDFKKANLNYSYKVNNNINLFSDFCKNAYNISEPFVHILLNKFDGRCTRCNHLTKSHTTIENTNDIWLCKDCPMDYNICCFKLFNE